eukprot:INCI12546.1.p1 GENE.INCI12546.1~~INCI12546.1.p1  ORF type:complete len:404 (+),score=32.86 INCI12546.1:134-1345(+)
MSHLPPLPLFGSDAIDSLASQVLWFCSAPDLALFSVCCHAAHRACHRAELWKSLLQADFDVFKHGHFLQAACERLRVSARCASESDSPQPICGAHSEWETCYRRLRQARGIYFHFHDPSEISDVRVTLQLHGPGLKPHGQSLHFVEVQYGMEINSENFPFDTYQVALVTSDASDTDASWTLYRDVLGDWLDEFLRRGGSVIQMMFSVCDGNHLSVGGKWEARGRALICPGDEDSEPHLGLGASSSFISALPPSFLGATDAVSAKSNERHPLLSNICVLDGGAETFYSLGPVAPDAAVVARWSNGVPLVVVNTDAIAQSKHLGTRIALNMYPVSSSSGFKNLWTRELSSHTSSLPARPCSTDPSKDHYSIIPRRNDVGRLFVNCVVFGLIQGLANKRPLSRSSE